MRCLLLGLCWLLCSLMRFWMLVMCGVLCVRLWFLCMILFLRSLSLLSLFFFVFLRRILILLILRMIFRSLCLICLRSVFNFWLSVVLLCWLICVCWLFFWFFFFLCGMCLLGLKRVGWIFFILICLRGECVVSVILLLFLSVCLGLRSDMCLCEWFFSCCACWINEICSLFIFCMIKSVCLLFIYILSVFFFIVRSGDDIFEGVFFFCDFLFVCVDDFVGDCIGIFFWGVFIWGVC